MMYRLKDTSKKLLKGVFRVPQDKEDSTPVEKQ